MTRAQVGRIRALAEEAVAYHKQTAMCEMPATCGGCHWWGGYLAAIQDITNGVDPNTRSLVAPSFPIRFGAPLNPRSNQMQITINVSRRVPITDPGVYHWVPDGTLTGEIILQIDEQKLARLLGPRALRSKSHKSTLAGGAIVARAIHLTRSEV
jgi:hypothetical protein